MTEPAPEILYRRVNLLHSLMVAGWLVLLLTLAVVVILTYGKSRRMENDLARLEANLAAVDGRLRDLAEQVGEPAAAPGLTGAPAITTRPDAVAAVPRPAQPVATDQPADTRQAPAGYDVSPTDGLPTVDPNRPQGLPGWFHDLKTGSSPDPDNPMYLLIVGPRTVRDALAELARSGPEQAARQNIPADDLVLAGQLFLQTAEAEQAHRWASAAAASQPEHGRAWLVAGLASMKMGLHQRAVAELTDASGRAGMADRPEPFKALGEACVGAGKIEDAVAAYRKAVGLVPRDLVVASRLAELMVLARQVEPAIAQLRAILAADPKRSADRARLAKLLVTENRGKDALAVLQATPDDAPDDVRLHLARGQALLAEGDLAGAEAVFERTVETTPLSAEGWHFLGLARLKQRKNITAAAALERAIAIDSTVAASWEYLGVALANEGKLPEAIARLQEAVRLKIGSAQAHFILALLHLRQGQSESALAALRQAVQIDRAYLDRARGEPVFTSLPADNPIARFLKDPGP